MRTRLVTTLVMVASLLASGQALAHSGGVTHTVDCSSGTIADAMSASGPGDTIMISGTCNEAVVVNNDGITLDGAGQVHLTLDRKPRFDRNRAELRFVRQF